MTMAIKDLHMTKQQTKLSIMEIIKTEADLSLSILGI